MAAATMAGRERSSNVSLADIIASTSTVGTRADKLVKFVAALKYVRSRWPACRAPRIRTAHVRTPLAQRLERVADARCALLVA